MPRYEITCYETICLTRIYTADTPRAAKALAEADIASRGWGHWNEITLGTNGVEIATDLDTQATTVFDDIDG